MYGGIHPVLWVAGPTRAVNVQLNRCSRVVADHVS